MVVFLEGLSHLEHFKAQEFFEKYSRLEMKDVKILVNSLIFLRKRLFIWMNIWMQ